MATARRDGPRRRGPVLVLAALGAAVAWLRHTGRTRPVQQPDAVAERGPARPLPGHPRLVAVAGGQLRHGEQGEPAVTELHEGRYVLGRARDAEVHLADLTVSPRHALLEADREGRVVLTDLGARNGVSVDGIPVVEAELHDGNRLQLGDVQLVYRTDPRADGGGRSGGELGEAVSRDREESR